MGIFTKWKRLAKKENEYAEAHAEAAFDAHADPKIQLEQATAQAKESHKRVQATAATVWANEQMANSRLERLQRQQAELESQIKMELKAGNQDRARTVATSLASVRTQVEHQTTAVATAHAHAEAAKVHVQESQEQLTTILNSRADVLETLDTAHADEAFNAANAEMSSDTVGGIIPAVAEVVDKANREAATAQGTAALAQYDPEVEQLAITHDAITAQADDILAEFQAPADPSTNGQVTAPKTTP